MSDVQEIFVTGWFILAMSRNINIFKERASGSKVREPKVAKKSVIEF